MLKDALLQRYAQTFYFYGRWDAPYSKVNGILRGQENNLSPRKVTKETKGAD